MQNRSLISDLISQIYNNEEIDAQELLAVIIPSYYTDNEKEIWDEIKKNYPYLSEEQKNKLSRLVYPGYIEHESEEKKLIRLYCAEKKIFTEKEFAPSLFLQIYVNLIEDIDQSLGLITLISRKRTREIALKRLECLIASASIAKTATVKLLEFAEKQKKSSMLGQYWRACQFIERVVSGISYNFTLIDAALKMIDKILKHPRFREAVSASLLDQMQAVINKFLNNTAADWLVWNEFINLLTPFYEQKNSLFKKRKYSDLTEYFKRFCSIIFEKQSQDFFANLEIFCFPLEDLQAKRIFYLLKLAIIELKSTNELILKKDLLDFNETELLALKKQNYFPEQINDENFRKFFNKDFPTVDEETPCNLQAIKELTRTKYAKCLKAIAQRYYLGLGVERSIILAMQYYEEAAALGDPEAIFCLAQCHEENSFRDKKPIVDTYARIFELAQVEEKYARVAFTALKEMSDEIGSYAQQKLNEIEKKIQGRFSFSQANLEDIEQLSHLVIRLCAFKEDIAKWVYHSSTRYSLTYFDEDKLVGELEKLVEIFRLPISFQQKLDKMQNTFLYSSILWRLGSGFYLSGYRLNSFPLFEYIKQCQIKKIKDLIDFFENRSLKKVDMWHSGPDPVARFNRLLAQLRAATQPQKYIAFTRASMEDNRDLYFALGELYRDGVGGRGPQWHAAAYCFFNSICLRGDYYEKIIISLDPKIKKSKKAFDELKKIAKQQPLNRETAHALYYMAFWGDERHKEMRLSQFYQLLGIDKADSDFIVLWDLMRINQNDGFITDSLELAKIAQILEVFAKNQSIATHPIVVNCNNLMQEDTDEAIKKHQLVLWALQVWQNQKKFGLDELVEPALCCFVQALAQVDAIQLEGVYTYLIKSPLSQRIITNEDGEKEKEALEEKEGILLEKPKFGGKIFSFFRRSRQATDFAKESNQKPILLNEDNLPELKNKLESLRNRLKTFRAQGIADQLLALLSSQNEIKSEECIDRLEKYAKEQLLATAGFTQDTELALFLMALSNREMPQLLNQTEIETTHKRVELFQPKEINESEEEDNFYNAL